jgi:hypothetical protein
METVILRKRTEKNGTVVIPVPETLHNQDLDLVVVMQPVKPRQWRPGFFEETYGSLADDPIERPEQLPEDERDPIE